ncbi:MAG: branched-chain amino acid ABC transporter permease [Acetobacteraceae bacterium]
MPQIEIVKACFIALPLMILAWWVMPLRWELRLPVGIIVGVLVAFGLAASVPSGDLAYLTDFCTMAGIYAILTLGLNCQWGLAGHPNFGIAGFFAVGAFATALFTTTMPTGILANYSKQAFGLGMPFLIGIAAAAVISAIVGLLICVPILGLRTDFLAIATLGIAAVIRLIFQNERWLANGPQPLTGIPQPLGCVFKQPTCSWLPQPLVRFFSPLQLGDYDFLYLVIVTLFLAGIYLALERIARSPWGRVLRAVRDEEASAGMSGKDVTWYRVESFVVGAFIMGIGGALYAHYVISIDYSHFQPLFGTFIIWVMLMLGGSGNNKGAILGAFAVWLIWGGTSFVVQFAVPLLAAISPALPSRDIYLQWVLISILLGAVVLFRPEGLIRERKVVSDFLPKDVQGKSQPGE